jgi:RNA polymerase sigma factor (sigma-70 family)
MTATAPARIDLAALYREHGRVVLRRIRRFYRAEQAQDILQEVFERALRSADSYRGDSTPVNWLFGITTGHCLARLRDERRRRHLLEEVGEIAWSCPVSESTTEARIFLAELWRTVDPELAQIGVHYFVDDMSQADIGALLGVTGRTVSNRLRELQELATAAATPPGGSP